MVVIARTRGGEYLPVTSKALHTIVKAGTIPADYDCLYPFKRAKDFETTAEFANYQHQYVLDDTGGGVGTGVTHRRVASELAGNKEGQHGGSNGPLVGGGGRRHNLLMSKNARINAEVAAAVTSVVIAIERTKHCRVLRLNTDFVLDEDDNLWLAGATSCEVAARPATTGSLEDSNNQRGGRPVGEGKHALATELRCRKHETEQTSDVISDEKFSQLLQRVGYRSPIKSRAAGGSDHCRHHPRAKPIATSRKVTTTQGKNGEIMANARNNLAPSLQGMMSNTESGSQWMGSGDPFDSETVSFDWAAPASGEGSDASDLDEDTGDGGSCSTGRSPSPPRPAPTKGFNSTVAKLDQAATNRIYGSTQVSLKSGVMSWYIPCF